MAPPKRPWFRFYVEAVHDRKLRRLKPETRWLFVACLAAARSSPVPGVLLVTEHDAMEDSDLADYAGMDVRSVRSGLAALTKVGVIERTSPTDREPIAWRVTSWDARQYESDDVTARTAKHRLTRRSAADGTPDGTSKERSKNVDATSEGTPPETEADTENRTSSSTSAEPPACQARDDDDPTISGAARRLAELDLERREAEAGSVGDRERWLTVVARRRASEVRAFLGGAPDPNVTIDQVVAALAPRIADRPTEARVSFDETPEQQLARLRAQHDLVDDQRDRDAIADQIHDLEHRLATTDR